MPDRETLRLTLIQLLEADTGEKYADLQESANLRDGLGLDSVDVVSVVSQIRAPIPRPPDARGTGEAGDSA